MLKAHTYAGALAIVAKSDANKPKLAKLGMGVFPAVLRAFVTGKKAQGRGGCGGEDVPTAAYVVDILLSLSFLKETAAELEELMPKSLGLEEMLAKFRDSEKVRDWHALFFGAALVKQASSDFSTFHPPNHPPLHTGGEL